MSAVTDLVSVCNPFFNTFLIKNIILLYPRLSSVTTGSRGWLGSFLLFWEVQFFCSAISLLTKARLGSLLRMLFWEMQFFCWPSFFLHRDVREARSVTRDSTLTYSDRSDDACPRVREPKTFTGCANDFKEWTFAVELGLRANRIVKEDHEVDYATSYLGGNALLW